MHILNQIFDTFTLLTIMMAAIKELTPEPEPTPEKVLAERLGEISKRLRKSETRGDRKTRDSDY